MGERGICKPMQTLAIRQAYLQRAYLRNFTVGVLNSRSENSANAQKIVHEKKAIFKKLLHCG